MALDDIKKKDRAAALRALRNHLVDTLKSAEPNVVAGLVKQLQSVLAELDQVDRPAEGSIADDLAKRRADRIAEASASVDSGRRNQQRRKGSGGVS